MLFEAWDTCDREDLELPRPFGRRGQQRLCGEIHDLIEALRRKEWNTGETIAPLPSVGVVEHHRFHQPRRLAQSPDFGHVTWRKWRHRMEDEPAGRYPKDRQRSAMMSAENAQADKS